ncbi:hypothetical protein SAMN05216570_2573 [Dyella sp. OK004]|uniref:hypothetical protein n=1 Tax=Dyella sp. OK004 TaxID=1855292 RepID=UPI0008EBFEC7|nr:hypothetical protein [Dyella sp. OK004]SFS11832.1 hypothetical protein SAMN05216570_2573 [Dyella sp. OK004]
MKRILAHVGVLAIGLFGATLVVASPRLSVTHQTSSADRQSIELLLRTYTRCVTERDEAGFRALLLDDNIPFASVQESTALDHPPDLRRYEDFRRAVFANGRRYRQAFYNIRIEQDGPLAQASLDFVTETVSGNRSSSSGWKVLQLVKVGSAWKIASELYTVK